MPTITSGAERYLLETAAQLAASSVDGQGFSPAMNDRAQRGTALPEAVAEDEGPERQPPGAQRRSKSVHAMVLSLPLPYQPFPKQQQFHASPAKYRLFGGAAGPGKSKALLMEAILQAHEHPGANTLLLRRTFPELEQSLLLYFRRDVPRELYKNFNESKHVVTWQNNSTTRFGYCQSESDVYQYQGAEFLFIGIDELTLFTLRQWQFLTSRNRCPIPKSFPCMAGATNPGNIGHAWVKSLWIDKQPAPGMENPSEYDPADYDFIAARVSDNPVYAGDENYLKTLRALPSHLRRAFLDGDWDVFAGQYFDNFDCERHVIRAEKIRWKPWWPRWISIDWGFEHPAAVYWHCAIPANGNVAQVFRPEGSTLRAKTLAPKEASYIDHSAADPSCDAAHQPSASVQVSRSAGFQPANLPSTGADPCRDEAHSATAPTASSAVGAQHAAPGSAQDPLSHMRDGAAETGSGFDPGDAAGMSNGASSPSTFAGRSSATPLQDQEAARRIVTYREYVTRRTTPRDLAREIVERSVQSGCHSEAGPFSDGAEESAFRPQESHSRSLTPIREDRGWVRDDRERQSDAPAEKIDAIYLSPDAFAHRTGEASIAEQMGDIFAAAGLPRPVPADDDRVGGWMLMYQMLDAGEWLITDNCFELIRTLPSLVRDPVRVEDIEKCDGDDPADAARYGLKSRYAAHRGDPGGWRSRMPLADRLAAHAYSPDPTIHAMQARKFLLEESRGPHRVPFRHGPHRRR